MCYLLSFAKSLGTLQETCCKGHHTYIHAQQLLTHLSRRARGRRFRRLSQELEQYAASKRGPSVWRMMPLFLPPHVLQGNEVSLSAFLSLNERIKGSCFLQSTHCLAQNHNSVNLRVTCAGLQNYLCRCIIAEHFIVPPPLLRAGRGSPRRQQHVRQLLSRSVRTLHCIADAFCMSE